MDRLAGRLAAYERVGGEEDTLQAGIAQEATGQPMVNVVRHKAAPGTMRSCGYRDCLPQIPKHKRARRDCVKQLCAATLHLNNGFPGILTLSIMLACCMEQCKGFLTIRPSRWRVRCGSACRAPGKCVSGDASGPLIDSACMQGHAMCRQPVAV